jgi:hypothetical protein
MEAQLEQAVSSGATVHAASDGGVVMTKRIIEVLCSERCTHCAHTLYAHTVFIPYMHTLSSYLICPHCPHTPHPTHGLHTLHKCIGPEVAPTG